MTNEENFLVSIIGRDRVGVVSEVTGYLFDIGANVADSSYAVLGEGFEFTAVVTFSSVTDTREIETGLSNLSALAGARIAIAPFDFDTTRGETATISHTIEITGGDRPGLIARVSEVLMEYGANIVRMSSKRSVDERGIAHYRTRFAVCADKDRVDALSAALSNTAGSLRLNCDVEAVK